MSHEIIRILRLLSSFEPSTEHQKRKQHSREFFGRVQMKRLLALAALVTFAGVVAANTGAGQELLKQIESYRHWTTLTAKPVTVEFSSLAG